MKALPHYHCGSRHGTCKTTAFFIFCWKYLESDTTLVTKNAQDSSFEVDSLTDLEIVEIDILRINSTKGELIIVIHRL